MLTKISHAGLPRRFFKIGTQNTDKKVAFFSKNSEIVDPFHVPRGTRPMLKRTPFYRKILVGDDNINGSSGTPGNKLWHYTGCAQLVSWCIVKSTFSSLFWYTLDILNSMLIKTGMNLPNKTGFSNKNWNLLLSVCLIENMGWSKILVDIILAFIFYHMIIHCIFYK